MTENTLTVTCPCCETKLVVDPDTGTILREERVIKREHSSLDEAFGAVKANKKDSEDRLARAFSEAKNRDSILEKKFQEARKKAAENPDAPVPRPFDGD
jgi:uncharacterized Zn finger protein (UPF0148 family)